MANDWLNDIVDAIEDDFDEVIHKSMNDAALAVVPNSPEDTGRFKGNWLVSIDQIGDDFDEDNFATGSGISTVRDIAQDAKKFTIKRNSSISLYNNVAEDTNHYAQTVGYDQSGSKALDLMDMATSETLRTLDGN